MLPQTLIATIMDCTRIVRPYTSHVACLPVAGCYEGTCAMACKRGGSPCVYLEPRAAKLPTYTRALSARSLYACVCFESSL